MTEPVTGRKWPAGPFVLDLDRLEPLSPSDLASLEDRDSVSIGMANGPCSGPSLAAAVAVDLLVVGPDTTFGQPGPWVDVVIRRGVGISGRKVIAYLAMSNRQIDAATALQWGLVNVISPDPTDEAQRLADEIALRSSVAVEVMVTQARRGAAADYVRIGVETLGWRSGDGE